MKKPETAQTVQATKSPVPLIRRDTNQFSALTHQQSMKSPKNKNNQNDPPSNINLDPPILLKNISDLGSPINYNKADAKPTFTKFMNLHIDKNFNDWYQDAPSFFEKKSNGRKFSNTEQNASYSLQGNTPKHRKQVLLQILKESKQELLNINNKVKQEMNTSFTRLKQLVKPRGQFPETFRNTHDRCFGYSRTNHKMHASTQYMESPGVESISSIQTDNFSRMLQLNNKRIFTQVKRQRTVDRQSTMKEISLIQHSSSKPRTPNLQMLEPIDKIHTQYVVAISKLPYRSYQKFYGFREGASLGVCDKNLYLVGGYTPEYDNHSSLLHKFDFSKKAWMEVNQKGDYVPRTSKVGQTVEEYKGTMYFIGGMSINLMGKKRLFSSQLLGFNGEREEWIRVKFIDGVRYHSSVRIGSNVLAFGGINEKEEYNMNISIISMVNQSNAKVYRVPFPQYLEDENAGIAYHQIVSTLQIDSKKRVNILEDGIYCFGGKDNNGEFPEGLRVLKMDQNNSSDIVPVRWVLAKTEGRQPSGRIQHTMNLLPKIMSIVVIGGRGPNNEILKDMLILNLYNMNWYRPEVVLDQPALDGITDHASTTLNNKIYIFGGLTGKHMANTCLLEIEIGNLASELDQVKFSGAVPALKSGLRKTHLNSFNLPATSYLSSLP